MRTWNLLSSVLITMASVVCPENDLPTSADETVTQPGKLDSESNVATQLSASSPHLLQASALVLALSWSRR